MGDPRAADTETTGEMKFSETMVQVAPALFAAQTELAEKVIAADAENDHFHNKYATLEAIMKVVRPVLLNNGLTLIQSADETVIEDGVLALRVTTLLLHKSGEWARTAVVMPLAKRDPHGAGGAITYGRRYGLSTMLGLVVDTDDDGNEASIVSQPGTQRRQIAARLRTNASATAQSCPKCGGAMFDNRASKRNPKAPDFKCRSRSCDGVIWPPKDGVPDRDNPREPAEVLADGDGPMPWDEGYDAQ